VQKPGRYDWFPGMTVVDVIQAAGGFTSTNHWVWIERTEGGCLHRIAFNADTIPYGLKKPFLLQDGDMVSVPKNVIIERPNTARACVKTPDLKLVNDPK
jgi:protein involved in polysaccharide export with SLBB domain